MKVPRRELLDRLNDVRRKNEAILAVGAGIGLTAKFAERGGADLIVVYNSGWFRMNGHVSSAGNLAFGDANGIVLELGERSILPVVQRTPVIAGVYAIDPTRNMRHLLERIDGLGFSGVINFPSVGRIDGTFRLDLEAAGLGFDKEVAMIQLAHEMGLFTMAYCFTPDEASAMAAAGVDVVVAHAGLTTGGTVGAATAMGLDEAKAHTNAILGAAKSLREDLIMLCHGGPISEPADVAEVLAATDAMGFVAASSVERIPVERAIESAVREFKGLSQHKDGAHN